MTDQKSNAEVIDLTSTASNDSEFPKGTNSLLQQLAMERELREEPKDGRKRRRNGEAVDTMSIKQLKALIKNAGLSFSDCIEKTELIQRAKQASSSDFLMAQKLQKEEYDTSRNNDADFARQLQAEEQRRTGQRKSSSSSSSSSSYCGSHHRAYNPRFFTDPLKLYVNSLGGIDGNLPVVHFSDVTSGKPLELLFTGGMMATEHEISFVNAFLPQETSIVHIGPLSSFYPPQFDGRPPTTYIAASMVIRGTYATGKQAKDTSNPRGCCHSKLYLVRYSTFLRVMVTSSNPSWGEWHGGSIGQIAWVMDMPKRNQNSIDAAHPFAKDLECYLSRMFDGQHTDVWNKWSNFLLRDFDFTVCGEKTHLICSIPGIHKSQPLQQDVYDAKRTIETTTEHTMYCGFRRVHHLLRTKMKSDFFNAAKRRGNSRLSGGDFIEATCSSVSNYNYGLHGNLMKAFEGNDQLSWDRFRLFFPSQSQAKYMKKGGTSVLTCDQPSFAKNIKRTSFNPPLRGCETKRCDKVKCKSQAHKLCLVHKYRCPEKQRLAGRVGIGQHTKMLLRCSTKIGKTYGRGWLYAGSHNLSSSAWGQGCLEGKKNKSKAKDAVNDNYSNLNAKKSAAFVSSYLQQEIGVQDDEIVNCLAEGRKIIKTKPTKAILEEPIDMVAIQRESEAYQNTKSKQGTVNNSYTKPKKIGQPITTTDMEYITNRVNHYELGVLLIDVPIKNYETVIPWDRSTTEAMEAMRYDNSTEVPFGNWRH